MDLTINETGRERALADTAEAQAQGFIFEGQTLFAVGTQVMPDAYRASRKCFEEYPLAGALLQGVQAAYAKEQRRDDAVEIPHLVMTERGEITRGAGALPIAPWALGQLVTRAGGPTVAGSWLRQVPLDLRRHDVNYFLPRGYRTKTRKVEGGREEEYQESIPVKLRTRLEHAPNGKPSRRGIYAALSPRYNTGFDYPVIVEEFLKKLSPEARGEFQTDGRLWQLRAYYHSDFEPESVVVGDVHRGAVWVRGADDGSGAIQSGATIYRARCVNLTEIPATKKWSVRHNRRDLGEEIERAIAAANATIEGFRDKWAEASTRRILEGVHGEAEPAHIFLQLAERRLVHIAGVSDEDMAECLMVAWRQEPGYSLAHLSMAVSRAAHENEWGRAWATEELEEQAGELAYVRVWNVPAYVPAEHEAAVRGLLEIN